jgi:hypothetical protein
MVVHGRILSANGLLFSPTLPGSFNSKSFSSSSILNNIQARRSNCRKRCDQNSGNRPIRTIAGTIGLDSASMDRRVGRSGYLDAT